MKNESVEKSLEKEYSLMDLKGLGKEIWALDFREEKLSNISAIALKQYLESLGLDYTCMNFLLLDNLENSSNPYNILHLFSRLENIKIIATARKNLREEIELLLNKPNEFFLFPLDFYEFLNFKGKEDLKRIVKKNEIRSLLLKNRKPRQSLLSYYLEELQLLYEEYILYGGLPSVILASTYADKEKLLEDYMENLFQSFYKNIRESSKPVFKKLIYFLAQYSGEILNIHQLHQRLGIARVTLEHYLELLKEHFVIYELYPFARQKNKEIIKGKRIYFYDNGIRNAIINNFTPLNLRLDNTQLLHSALFINLQNNLKEKDKIYYWRTQSGNGLSFIRQSEDILEAIEIDYEPHKLRIPSGIRYFCKDYPVFVAVVGIANKLEFKTIYDYPLWYVPLWMIY